MIKIIYFIWTNSSSIVLIVSFILLPFLFSQMQRVQMGHQGQFTGQYTRLHITTQMTRPTPKTECRQSYFKVLSGGCNSACSPTPNEWRHFICFIRRISGMISLSVTNKNIYYFSSIMNWNMFPFITLKFSNLICSVTKFLVWQVIKNKPLKEETIHFIVYSFFRSFIICQTTEIIFL